jgi:hypothetical protein
LAVTKLFKKKTNLENTLYMLGLIKKNIGDVRKCLKYFPILKKS